MDETHMDLQIPIGLSPNWPLNLEPGSKCQAVDGTTGLWYDGFILEMKPDFIKVRCPGFPRTMSDMDIYDSDCIREPVGERLLDRKAMALTRLQATRYLQDDLIQYWDDDKAVNSTVKSNDPFKGLIQMATGEKIKYEKLLGNPTTVKSPDALTTTKKSSKKNNVSETTCTSVKKKAKKKATTIAAGDPAPTMTEISSLVGNSPGSPLKVNLTSEDLTKVKKKVDNWKQGNNQALTVNELKKLNNTLQSTNDILRDLKDTFCSFNTEKPNMKADWRSVSICSNKSSTQTSGEEDDTGYTAAELFPSFSNTIQRKVANWLPVPVTCTNTATLNRSGPTHPTTCTSTVSSTEISSLQNLFFAKSDPVLSPQNDLTSTVHVDQQWPASHLNPPAASMQQQPSPQPNYLYKPIMPPSTSPHPTDPFSSYLSALSDSADVDNLERSFTSQPLQNRSPNTSPSPPLTDSQPGQPITLGGKISLATLPSLDDEDDDFDGEMTEFVDSATLQDVIVKSKSSRTAFVSRLTSKLFTVDELVGRNVNGLQNKQKLNPKKIEYMKRTLFAYFPASAATRESVWQRECVKAVDRTNRQRLSVLSKYKDV